MASENKAIKSAFAIFAVLIAASFFLVVLNAQLPAIIKFVLAAASLVACGYALAIVFKLECWGGLFMLRSQLGLKFIDELANKYSGAWQWMAEIGMIIGYGSFSYFLTGKKKITLRRFLKIYLPGTLLLIFLSQIVAPLAMAALLSMLRGGSEFAGAGNQLQQGVASIEIAKYVLLALLIIGGLSLMTSISIVLYGAMVGFALLSAVLGNGAVLAKTSPGGVPILPGINLPLFEGVAALAIVLIVHESLHGILARMHKLPIKSAGIVVLGFLPFGAFVDIIEKKLFAAKKDVQNAVLVAGTAANFATSLIFLFAIFAFLFATSSLRVSGIYIESGTLPSGSVLLAINNTPIESFAGQNLTPNALYSIKTDQGTFERKTDEKGKLGITYVIADKEGANGVFRYSGAFWFLNAVLRFLMLTFALNFIVGAINLVPLPLFDGYHIMKNGVSNKWVSNAVMYVLAASFLLTLFPWVLR